MARPQKNPLRVIQIEEHATLEKISRALSWPADQVARAKALLAVAEGKSFLAAAHLAGRKNSTTVSQLVVKFNQVGLKALVTGHGGGPALRYTEVEREHILKEFRRIPDRRKDGTATWSLKTLQHALQKAPDGFKVGTSTILKVLHEAGYVWQKDRSWCDTGKVIRVRKSGPVEVTDPDTLAKKN
jgi:transposase